VYRRFSDKTLSKTDVWVTIKMRHGQH